MKPLGIIARAKTGGRAGRAITSQVRLPSGSNCPPTGQCQPEFSSSGSKKMRTEQGRHSARPGKCRARAAGERTPTNPNKQWKSTREWSSHNENMGHLYLPLLFPRHRCTVLIHHNVTVLYSADSLFVTQPSSPLTRKSTSPPGRPTSDASAERRIILNYHRTALTSVSQFNSRLAGRWALGTAEFQKNTQKLTKFFATQYFGSPSSIIPTHLCRPLFLTNGTTPFRLGTLSFCY